MADALRGGIVINEIHAQPVAGASGHDTDGNGTVAATDEYVELLNTSNAAIDISGLSLFDPGRGGWFTFPPGSVLGAGGHAIVVTGLQAGGSLPAVAPGSLAFNAGQGSAVLNNEGDNVFLLDTATSGPTPQSYVAAVYGTWPALSPYAPATWAGAPGSTAQMPRFPAGLTQVGTGENFGALIPGEAIQRTPDGGNGFVNNQGETPGGDNWGTPLCFVGGTRILTPQGPVRIELLRPGCDLVTADGGVARLRWAGARRMRAADLAGDRRKWPVRIGPGALGPGCPQRAVTLSPQHRVLLRGPVAQDLGGAPEVLVPAQALGGLSGVSRPRPRADFVYHHLLCDRHEVLLAEGLPAESLYLGPMARAAMTPSAWAEIHEVFPDLHPDRPPEPARPLLRSGPVRRALAARMTAAAGSRATIEPPLPDSAASVLRDSPRMRMFP